MRDLVSLKIEQETVDKIMDHFAQIQSLLPGLITISKKQRQSLPKMGDLSLPFVKKVEDYCKILPDIAPHFMKIDEFKTDVSDVTHLQKIEMAAKQLIDTISDTKIKVGSEAYVAALMFYNAAKDAAKHNVEGAKEAAADLKKRFPRSKSKLHNNTNIELNNTTNGDNNSSNGVLNSNNGVTNLNDGV